MILGLTHPSSGSITVLGQPFDNAHRVEILKHMGALIESPSYYPNLTAKENLEIVRSLRGLDKAEIDQMADNIGIIHHGNMKFQDSLESLHAQGRSWLEIRTGQNTAALHVLTAAGLMAPQVRGARASNASDGVHFAPGGGSPSAAKALTSQVPRLLHRLDLRPVYRPPRRAGSPSPMHPTRWRHGFIVHWRKTSLTYSAWKSGKIRWKTSS